MWECRLVSTLIVGIYFIHFRTRFSNRDGRRGSCPRWTRNASRFSADNMSNVLCATGSSVKIKISALPQSQAEPLILKN